MKKQIVESLVAAAILASTTLANAQGHGHLNIGAVGTGQNDPLIFDNGADFATNSDYVKTLAFTNAGTYAGYFHGNITMTALAATPNYGGPEANAATIGSEIYAQLVSVDGPAGGVFAFWDADATQPTISLLCGTIGTETFRVSTTNASGDPFGHIHGRRFTATKPGIYIVAFKALDRSTNGEGGGPIHTDSEILKVYFQADINLVSLVRSGNVNTATFGGLANRTFHLEANSDLSSTNWTSVGSIPGNDYFLTLSETNASSPRFYRLRVTSP